MAPFRVAGSGLRRPANLRRALYAYNHSTLYVDAVLVYARVMRRDMRVLRLPCLAGLRADAERQPRLTNP